MITIEFAADAGPADILALLVHDGEVFKGPAATVDAAAGGALARALSSSRFTGGARSTLSVLAAPGVAAGHVLLTGAGAADKFDDLALETAAGQAYQAVKTSGGAVLA
ncbi:MAG: M17 family peptidase N-terminal domain-containing protein, partial [Brevundimonas sp.]